jgi:NADH:ubiquinone oxidoreductase subunit D
MITEDRLLLAELARLNRDVTPLAMRIMDHSATSEEHYAFADRLTAMARRLQTRGAHVSMTVDGVVENLAEAKVAQDGSAGRSGVSIGTGSAGLTLRT